MGELTTMDWDAVRVFLATTRAGSVSGAAKVLGVNATTVTRRLRTLEDELGTKLFDRRSTGYELNARGQLVLEAAERAESEMARLQISARTNDTGLQGAVRVTMADWVFSCVERHLSSFRDAFPDIRLTLVLGNDALNLSRREADVAFRVGGELPPNLVGRRLGTISFAGYVHTSLLGPSGQVDRDATHLGWIGEDDNGAAPSVWSPDLPAPRLAARSNSMMGTLAAVRAGYGVGRLARALGDSDSDLVRVCELSSPEPEVWALTHERLRRTARVQAVVRFLSPRLQEWLEAGSAPSATL